LLKAKAIELSRALELKREIDKSETATPKKKAS
jgi:hypothetical protein